MITILYLLIGAFLATTVAFSLVCATGVEPGRYESIAGLIRFHIFGFSTRKAIRQRLRPDRQKIAIALFMARGVFFVAIIAVALLEYFLRGS